MYNLIAQEEKMRKILETRDRQLLLVILLPTAATITLVLVSVTWYLRKRARRNKGWMDDEKESQSLFRPTMASPGNANDPTLQVFSFTDLVEATNNFSFENKLGEGGYGPVYMGILRNGQEIAVKRLLRTSTQGFEEFKNEVS
ncbi:G-type lectin S-receptor-like serine/threonine-protein kinase At1g11410 [Rhododendron vialii]|uniref:G-type lectin S-receptor-like serine/threonine-protein kinase At1g11410 n=1 Tax=Rhododendron vialii TaxID=182163 RepID=UPI0026603CCD|nr:G-type lectin S-receptor-like serine/threonine-protein kinase At1g11410 [Rhododendron vialii]